ncbi:MAG: hypothetical protein JXM70_26485 [Pirellulales bacterium]|nr:hypothetical protein [Pirellulales bacterium]
MNNVFRKLTIWMLIANLAIIAGVGEGLHLIPGCGHGIELGNRVLLLGVDLPQSDDLPAGDTPCVKKTSDLKIPIYDEDLCAICSLIGEHCTPSGPFLFIVAMPLRPEVPWIVLDEVSSAVILSFHSRAPPLV